MCIFKKFFNKKFSKTLSLSVWWWWSIYKYYSFTLNIIKFSFKTVIFNILLKYTYF